MVVSKLSKWAWDDWEALCDIFSSLSMDTAMRKTFVNIFLSKADIHRVASVEWTAIFLTHHSVSLHYQPVYPTSTKFTDCDELFYRLKSTVRPHPK